MNTKTQESNSAELIEHEVLGHIHGPHCNHTHSRLEPLVRQTPKVGRNDECPCGSQKKYKKCCGK